MNFFRKQTDKVANNDNGDDAPRAKPEEKDAAPAVDAAAAVSVGNNGAALIEASPAANNVHNKAMELEVVYDDPTTITTDDELSTVPLDSSHGDSPTPPHPPAAQVDHPSMKGEHLNGGEDSEGEYTDDDSEYTYDTDEEEEGSSSKKKGWFGFLRRGKKQKHDDDEEEDDSESEDEGGEEEEHDEHEEEHDEHEEEHESSDDEESPTHHLLNSPISSNIESPATTNNQVKEEEEALLMAQAIQRVQHRIESNGGNLYDALSERDKQLVDSLKGVEDEDTIRKVVAKSMQEEGGENKGVANLNGDGDYGKESLQQRDEPEGRNGHGPHGDDAVTEPSLHTETSFDTEPVTAGVKEESFAESTAVETETAVETKSHGDNGENDDEDDDEEQPTLEEQRSLLSLAAEHDRVDVIQELLNDSGPLYATLLAGVSPNNTDNNDNTPAESSTPAVFVPPPLHVAVAHGSVGVASCLLRMGADPSIRSEVPPAYLSGGYHPPSPRGGGGMEEDRNYKKYHGMSAWELAFGSTTVVVEDGAIREDAVEEEEEETAKRGWFGFGSPKKEHPDEESMVETTASSNNNRRRIKKKLPLNIPPAKLTGIRHAFAAEALRAIGSNEVHRLAQLLNAGMDPTMEVMPGKTFAGWAVEMDARDCCELLLLRSKKEATEVEGADPGADNAKGTRDGDQTKTDDAGPNGKERKAVEPPAPIQDERLVGLSLTDLQTLVHENETLLPHLTTCHSSLAHETHISQSIFQDIQASGGKGGLSSQSLLDLVRNLKEQRSKAEEAAQAWQRAWEEREDELDFFWEEVLDDGWREELAGVFSGVALLDPAVAGDAAANSSDTMEYWSQRFVNMDARITTLRTAITNLASENARHTAEIERHGMSGALRLTHSIREEVKEFEETLKLAREGEMACRRKIEVIQERIGGGDAVEGDGGSSPPPQQQGYHVDVTSTQVISEENSGVGDFQLQATIVPQQEEQQELVEERSQYSPPPTTTPRPDDSSIQPQREEDEGIVYPSLVDEGSIGSGDSVDEGIMVNGEDESIISEQGSGGSSDSQGVEDENFEGSSIGETNDIIEEDDDDTMEKTAQEEASSGGGGEPLSNNNLSVVQMLQEEATSSSSSLEGGSSNKKPSDAIAEGMSTAIVVHSTNYGQSMSSQIWDILKRIVGLGRVDRLQQSYHDAENHPSIMIV